jgi:hypothetical protein
MLKAYSLQQYEIDQNRDLDEERRNLLAQFGSATLELESVRSRMTNLELRQRAFVNAIAQRHQAGTEYKWVRIENNQLVGDFLEQPQQQAGAPIAPPADPPVLERVNGRG